MTLYWVEGRGVVDDNEEGVRIPGNAQPLGTYATPELRHQGDAFTWDPSRQVYAGDAGAQGPDFLSWLMNWRTRTPTGNNPGQVALEEGEQASWRQAEARSRAIPTRDVSTLTAGWQGDLAGRETGEGYESGNPDWWTLLDPGSPDAAPIMLALRDRIDQGTATAHERDLYHGVMGMAGDWSERASRPDPWSPLGDQLVGALATLALGATGGLAAAPLAAGGAGLTTTLGSLGTLAGIGGTAASTLGSEMDQEWLQNLGMGLGVAGGLAGGVGGLANLAGTGVQSLGDAARLASNAGRVVGSVGTAADNDVLRQSGGWLGTAGQLGGGVENLMNLVSGEGGSVSALAGLARPLSRLAGHFLQPDQPDQSGQSGSRPVRAAVQQPLYGEQGAQSSEPDSERSAERIQALLRAVRHQPQGSTPDQQAGASSASGTSAIQALLQAAGQARRSGGPLTDQDWLRRTWRRVDTPSTVLSNL